MTVEAILLIVIALSMAATALVGTVNRRAGPVAVPRPDRWNREPTALRGGVGILVAFAAGLWIWNDDLFFSAGKLFAKFAPRRRHCRRVK